MILSAPMPVLKQRAKALARKHGLKLHDALDRIAAQEGYNSWSFLSAHWTSPDTKIYDCLEPGDLVLLAARPGQGKTLTGLRLLADATDDGKQAIFFTLEDTRRDVIERLNKIGRPDIADVLIIDTSDSIDAHHIASTIARSKPAVVAVVDYLQLLDQRRTSPDLMTQIGQLKACTSQHDVIIAVLSQIDRSYDPAVKPIPDLDDIRLPNPVDMRLFTKACFLHGARARIDEIA